MLCEQYRFLPRMIMWSGRLGLVMCLSLIWGLPQAGAEWYVAGYGGLSVPNSLNNVKMDQLGLRTDTQLFSGALAPDPTGTVTQSLQTSDLSVNHPPIFGGKFFKDYIFGGKAGYFFNDEGLNWLGVELEAFTSRPTIKAQTANTTHDITFLPTSVNTDPPPPAAPPNCSLGATCQIQTSIPGTLSVAESKLRLMALAFNVVARYPGTLFQPYVGVGVGAFYFSSSTGFFQGRQVVPGLNGMAGVKVLVTEEFGLFLEGKYNRATLTNFDPTYGLSGEYSAFNFVAGLAYHF